MHETDDFILPVTRRTDKIVTRSVGKQTESNQSLKNIHREPETSAENLQQEVINNEINQTDQVITEVNNEVTEGEVNDQVNEEMTTIDY